ncbi:MAG: aspartate/glutamate racemase family protein [Elainellaceae cyanobacterium]
MGSVNPIDVLPVPSGQGVYQFADLEVLQYQNRWAEAAELFIAAAQSLERAGADFVVLCANTTHKLADDIRASVQILLLHIADATAEPIRARGIRKIGLLGTRFTMEQDLGAVYLKAEGRRQKAEGWRGCSRGR